MTIRAFVSGCATTALSDEESAFFAETQPLGLILFRRNCETPEQVRALTTSFRRAVGREDAPVMIDQEGGRVRRLRPPQWPDYPAGAVLGALGRTDRRAGKRAAWLQGRLMAGDLLDIGITIDCAPVLDVIVPGASEAIGDRSFGGDPDLVAELGRSLADGLLAGGVMPVPKHMPGQGRATVDSHYLLPTVETDLATLESVDFRPFVALADLPAGMTSHTLFTAVDASRPATTSATLIRDIIRGRIGFDGVLFSDDVSMNALAGDHHARGRAIFEAGCDIVLHCSGLIDDMRAIAEVSPELSGDAARRVSRMMAQIGTPEPFDAVAGRAEFDTLLSGVWAGA